MVCLSWLSIGSLCSGAEGPAWSDVSYELELSVDPISDRLEGRVSIDFSLLEVCDNLRLHFALSEPSALDFHWISVDGVPLEAPSTWSPAHIDLVLPPGNHRINASYSIPLSSSFNGIGSEGSRVYCHDSSNVGFSALCPCLGDENFKSSWLIHILSPASWHAISNARLNDRHERHGRAYTTFWPTPPIRQGDLSLAMGPLKSILINTDPVLTLWHPLNVATPDTMAISETHTSAIEFALNTTNYPLPLRKLDLVLLPGLRDYSTSKPGVIYYRLSGEHDRSLAQGDREWCQRIGREVSAQWIGQLVSPRDPRDSWFYCGLSDYLALMWLERTPKSWSPWISLYHRHVEDALEIDQSAGGITLIEEPAPLDPWARAKATTLLRQLDLSLGQDFFWERFRELVTQHAFASASWEEFARPLEENENFLGTLDDWNRGWLETDGVPRLQIQCEEDEQGRVTDCRLLKTRAQENDAFASMSIEVLIESKKERLSRVFVASAFTQERLHELIGHPAPRFALPDSSLRGWATSHFGELQLQEFVPLAPSLMTPMELYAQDLARSRDYEEGLIPVRERLQEIEIAIAHCKDDVSTQALWQRYHAAFRDLPITERNSWGQLAANRWLDRLDDSTATSAMARSWLTGCMRLPLDGSARTRLKRLLAGTWQPKALSISARDRREVLLALAAHGVHDMNSLALDSSGGEGRDWNLLLDAAQPNETKKREAFEEAWRESRSDQWLLDFAKALASGEPEETSWSLTANVLLKAEELLKTHPLEFVAQWIGIILEGPLTQADIATIDQYLWKHSKASRSLRRWVALCRHRIAG